MSADQHAADLPGHAGATAHHEPVDHGEDHGHDDHAHAGEAALGPLDLAAWGAGLSGVVVAVVISVCLAISTGAI